LIGFSGDPLVGDKPRVICDRTKALKLRQSGKSLGQIAAELKLAKTTVHRIVENATTRMVSAAIGTSEL
jgi:orotate phosphoribosyltransferase-like protein